MHFERGTNFKTLVSSPIEKIQLHLCSSLETASKTKVGKIDEDSNGSNKIEEVEKEEKEINGRIKVTS